MISCSLMVTLPNTWLTLLFNIFTAKSVKKGAHRYQILDHISDHRVDKTAVKQAKGWITAKNGRRTRKMTTKGWYFKAEWRDGTSTWVPLKEIKEECPVQVAEYAQMNEKLEEPALAWWTPHVLRNHDRIIAKVKSRSQKKTHKYGIKIPGSVAEAYQLDKENDNSFWADAIRLEMKENRVAFDILDNNRQVEPERIYLVCYTLLIKNP